MDREDVNKLLYQYRNGFISADIFAKDMRQLDYTLPQIIQIMDAVNRVPATRTHELPVPLPAGSAETSLPVQSFDTGAVPPPAAPVQQSQQPVQMARDVLESRMDRALPSDAPVDTGSPAGNMMFPRNLPQAPAAAPQSAPMTQQAPMPMRRQDVMGDVGGAPQGGGSFLTNLIRGDFREGADQRVMEAMRRQREESGVPEGRAMGGAAESKKSSRDDVLNKALDIIHAMLTRR